MTSLKLLNIELFKALNVLFDEHIDESNNDGFSYGENRMGEINDAIVTLQIYYFNVEVADELSCTIPTREPIGDKEAYHIMMEYLNDVI